jgi:hypothetical protein
MQYLHDFYSIVGNQDDFNNKSRSLSRIIDVVGLHDQLQTYVTYNDIEDSLDCTLDKKVLSAKQGNELYKEIQKLSSTFYDFIECDETHSVDTCKPLNLRYDIEKINKQLSNKIDKTYTFSQTQITNLLYNYVSYKQFKSAMEDKISMVDIVRFIEDHDITKKGNEFNKPDTLVCLDKNGKIPFNTVCEYVKNEDPTVSTNPQHTIAPYLNTVSGELFFCTSSVANANHWIGTRGTEVKPFYGSLLEYHRRNKFDIITNESKKAYVYFSKILNYYFEATIDNIKYIELAIEQLQERENIMNLLNKPKLKLYTYDKHLLELNRVGFIDLYKEVRDHYLYVQEQTWVFQDKLKNALSVKDIDSIKVVYNVNN